MKTVILDDELPAVNILKGFTSKIPFLDLQLASTDAFEALDLLNSQPIDLLFSDIEMPDISGLELIGALKNPPMIILTTAYENFALKGYELDVVDYLVKPIRFERFLKSVTKAHHLFKLENRTLEADGDFLLIKVEYQTVKIAIDDILYIEGLKDYVKVFTKDKMYLTRLNVKSIEQKLSPRLFARIHRSYIVALSKITSFQKGQIFIGKTTIPIGSSYQELVSDRLG